MQDLVDLAGSERALTHSFSAGTRSKEGSHVNRSLVTLGAVIRKLRFNFLKFSLEFMILKNLF